VGRGTDDTSRRITAADMMGATDRRITAAAADMMLTTDSSTVGPETGSTRVTGMMTIEEATMMGGPGMKTIEEGMMMAGTGTMTGIAAGSMTIATERADHLPSRT